MPFVKHEGYRKFTVENVVKFCGWELLQRMLDLTYDRKMRALIATVFLTGARAQEAIPYPEGHPMREIYGLKPSHFVLDWKPEFILAQNVPVLKRWEYAGGGKRIAWKCTHCQMRWREAPPREAHEKHQGKIVEYITRPTKRLVSYRSFPISKTTPLTPTMVEWIEQTEGDSFLFDGITYMKFYQHCRFLTKVLKPWLNPEIGEAIRPHWFRAQRACQLGQEKGASVEVLMKYFHWEDFDTAKRYTSKAVAEELAFRGVG